MVIRNEVIRAPPNTVQIVMMAKDTAPSVFRALTGATKTQQDTPERFRSGNLVMAVVPAQAIVLLQ